MSCTCRPAWSTVEHPSTGLEVRRFDGPHPLPKTPGFCPSYADADIIGWFHELRTTRSISTDHGNSAKQIRTNTITQRGEKCSSRNCRVLFILTYFPSWRLPRGSSAQCTRRDTLLSREARSRRAHTCIRQASLFGLCTRTVNVHCFQDTEENIPPQLKNSIIIRHYPSNVKGGLKRLFGSRLQGLVVLERLFGGVLLAGLFARSRTLSA